MPLGYEPWGGQGPSPDQQGLSSAIDRYGPAIAKGIHGGMQAPDVIKKYIQHIMNGEMDPKQASVHARLESMGALNPDGSPNMQHPLFGNTYGGVAQGAPQPMPAPQGPPPGPTAPAMMGAPAAQMPGRGELANDMRMAGGLAPQLDTSGPTVVPSANAAAPGQGLYGKPVGSSYREGPGESGSGTEGLSAGVKPVGAIDVENLTNNDVDQLLALAPMIKALRTSDSPEDKLLRTMLTLNSQERRNQNTVTAGKENAQVSAGSRVEAAKEIGGSRVKSTEMTVQSAERRQDKELKVKWAKLHEDWNKALLAAETRLKAVKLTGSNSQVVARYRAEVSKLGILLGNASSLRKSMTNIVDPTISQKAAELEPQINATLERIQQLDTEMKQGGTGGGTTSESTSKTTPGKANLLNAFGLE